MRKVVNFLTGLFFTIFTAYQIFLLVQIEENRFGRLLGIAVFLCFSAASFFSLIHKMNFKIARSTLLIAALSFNFIFKLLNAQLIFSSVNFSNIPSILNCAIYIFSELGFLTLLVYYLFFRLKTNNKSKLKSDTIRKITQIMMYVVIFLFVSCLIMEIVLILVYNTNITFNMKTTLISRFLYCFAFVGMAVGFMLRNKKGKLPEVDYIYEYGTGTETNEIDKDFVISEGERVIPERDENITVGEIDKDFVISEGERVIPEMDEKITVGEIDKDFIL